MSTWPQKRQFKTDSKNTIGTLHGQMQQLYAYAENKSVILQLHALSHTVTFL